MVLVGRRRIRGAQVGDGDRELERGWRRPLAPATSGCCQATGPMLRGWAPAPGLLSSPFLHVPLLNSVPERRLPMQSVARGAMAAAR